MRLRMRVLLWAVLAAMFAFRISANVVDLDLYHQMALAREALRLGYLPTTDLWAFTPTLSNVFHHEWGAGFIAYALATTFGGAGILGLKYLLAFSAALVVIRLGISRSPDGLLACVLAPIAIMLSDYGFSPVRAQEYSFLFAALTLWFIELDRTGRRYWVVPNAIMFVAWVNLHGGFVVGPALLAAYAVERVISRERWLHIAAVLLGLAALVALNPYGVAYYRHVLHAVTMPRPYITEWAPIWHGDEPLHHRFAFVVALASAAYAFAARPNWSERRGAILLAATAVMAARHSRMLPFFAICWLTYVPNHLDATWLGAQVSGVIRRRARAVAVGSAVVGTVFVVMFAAREPWQLVVPNEPGHLGIRVSFPVGAVNFLRESRFRGTAMTPFQQGAFVAWKLHPEVKVSLDSRYEAAYPESVFRDVNRFYAGRDVDAVLSRYAPDLVLAPRAASALTKQLHWPRIYEDAGWVLLRRPDLVLPPPSSTVCTVDSFP